MTSDVPDSEDGWFDAAMLPYGGWLVVVLFAVVALATFRDYGVTWDEQVQAEYGELVLDYFGSGFRDQSCNEYKNLFLYGPVFESACAIVYGVLGRAKYEVRHLLIGVCAVLTVLGVYLMGRRWPQRYTGVFAAVLLLMLPRFYGHAFNNSKDIPFACAFVWAMYAMTRLLSARGLAWPAFLWCGGAVGLALAVRAGGFLLFAFLAFGALLVGAQWLGARRREVGAATWRAFGRRAAGLVFAAWLVMVVFWPWMHQNPVWRPIQAFLEMTRFSSSYPVLFAGETIESSALPRRYLLQYLLITTPPVVALFFVAGLGALLCFRRPDFRSPAGVPVAMTLLWFFFPIVYVAAKRPNIYDGVRHFLFILPALALIAGAGAAFVQDRLRLLLGRPAIATIVVLGLALVPVKELAALHPYQSTYFNVLAGGLAGASGRYETDYWAASYKEAAEWVNEQPSTRPDGKIVLLLAANANSRVCAEHYLAPNVETHLIWTGKESIPRDFDYLLATSRYGVDGLFFPSLPRAHVIGRQGATFCVVKKGPGPAASP